MTHNDSAVAEKLVRLAKDSDDIGSVACQWPSATKVGNSTSATRLALRASQLGHIKGSIVHRIIILSCFRCTFILTFLRYSEKNALCPLNRRTDDPIRPRRMRITSVDSTLPCHSTSYTSQMSLTITICTRRQNPGRPSMVSRYIGHHRCRKTLKGQPLRLPCSSWHLHRHREWCERRTRVH